MSFEKDVLNATLANLDLAGFANPPLFMAGEYNFKCALASDGKWWVTELHADHNLLGWNDLYLYSDQEFAKKLVAERFGLDPQSLILRLVP